MSKLFRTSPRTGGFRSETGVFGSLAVAEHANPRWLGSAICHYVFVEDQKKMIDDGVLFSLVLRLL